MRTLDQALKDSFLSGAFNLYNSTLRMSIDTKIDLVERAVIQRMRKEIDFLKEQLGYLENENAE